MYVRLLSFATQEDAVAFQKQYGGSVLAYADALKDVNAKK
jgi:nitrous oxide reductase accessory protein NosL